MLGSVGAFSSYLSITRTSADESDWSFGTKVGIEDSSHRRWVDGLLIAKITKPQICLALSPTWSSSPVCLA
jgi:hypothetical protein